MALGLALYHEVALTSALHHLEQGLGCVTLPPVMLSMASSIPRLSVS